MSGKASPEGIPPNRPKAALSFPDGLKDRYPKWMVAKAIGCCGSTIAKVVEYHMVKNKVFTDSDEVETSLFRQELYKVMGPGAELVLEELGKIR